ncbi:DedA family protein [Metabacillus rhizolycopersici]|jgi:membrane protein DedA with SNARE-associated domain|uniref:DedA family protein n=1 Tax=Metabacillus rhizolycopersici TaxID=2875709 RepID=A0ABS7UKW0_9BACI|nr:DedA family protein [Metabacillus rhizolycopersici]MBZ5748948.1 DedA family protein [Metabacillus rhizolycopersici]
MEEAILNLLEWLTSLGYLGIALGLMLEVIPSEIVLGYGGYMIILGKIGFWEAFAAGVIGGTIAQLILYWIGSYGGRPFLEKYGKFLLLKKHHLDLSESWFEKYGSGVIFGARFIPVVRHAISIPAGIAKMSLWKFTLYTVAAMIPWTIFFLYLGIELGSNWMYIKEAARPYLIPMISLAFLMAATYYLVKKFKGPRTT